MPFVRISLREGTSPATRKAVADGVYEAMLATINVPAGDRFQVVTEHSADGLIYDPGYVGIRRTDGVVFIQVTLNQGQPRAEEGLLRADRGKPREEPRIEEGGRLREPRGSSKGELVVRERPRAVRGVRRHQRHQNARTRHTKTPVTRPGQPDKICESGLGTQPPIGALVPMLQPPIGALVPMSQPLSSALKPTQLKKRSSMKCISVLLRRPTPSGGQQLVETRFL